MKTNTKTKTVVLVSSLILSLSAIGSYAKPSHNSSSHRQVKQTKQHAPRAISKLPKGYKTVKHASRNYYFVGNVCFTYTNRGFVITTAPKNIRHDHRAPVRKSHERNYRSHRR